MTIARRVLRAEVSLHRFARIGVLPALSIAYLRYFVEEPEIWVGSDAFSAVVALLLGLETKGKMIEAELSVA